VGRLFLKASQHRDNFDDESAVSAQSWRVHDAR